MNTSEIFLVAMVLIFALPFLVWRLGRTEYFAPLGRGADRHRHRARARHPRCGLSRVLSLRLQPGRGAVAEWHRLVGSDVLRAAGGHRTRPETRMGASTREQHGRRSRARRAADYRQHCRGGPDLVSRLDRPAGPYLAIHLWRGHGLRGDGAADPGAVSRKARRAAYCSGPAHPALREHGRHCDLGRARPCPHGLEPRGTAGRVPRRVRRRGTRFPPADAAIGGA